MKRIRQGHTRWRLKIEHDVRGRASLAEVFQCTAIRVTHDAVTYFDGTAERCISHNGWMRMCPTRRRAIREMHAVIDDANRQIRIEFEDRWSSI